MNWIVNWSMLDEWIHNWINELIYRASKEAPPCLLPTRAPARSRHKLDAGRCGRAIRDGGFQQSSWAAKAGGAVLALGRRGDQSMIRSEKPYFVVRWTAFFPLHVCVIVAKKIRGSDTVFPRWTGLWGEKLVHGGLWVRVLRVAMELKGGGPHHSVIYILIHSFNYEFIPPSLSTL